MTFDDYILAVRDIYQAKGRKLELNAPATPKQLQGFDRPVPDALAFAWQYANGARKLMSVFRVPGVPDALDFWSAKEARHRVDSRVVLGPGWFPFGGYGWDRWILCLDASLASAQPGQVVCQGRLPREVAPSFEAFLGLSLAEIRADKYFA